MTFKIGVDVGGTFTDLVLWSDDDQVETCKVLSTADDPSIGVFNGLRSLAGSRGLSVKEFARATRLIVHGTTVTTNAVLTRSGARCGLLTTEGVRDALEMRRGIREEQYNNRYQNVVPLVPRRRRLPVGGRLDFRGEEITPLSLEDVREAAVALGREGVSAVAICFLHSYVSPVHEEAAAAVVREILPDAHLSVSSAVLPTIRFYDRISTTVLNAYVDPVLRDYMKSLTGRLADAGFGGVLLIMQSNGGVALPDLTLECAASTLLSGPAAGPRAAAVVAGVHGNEDCILVDMGGTSFDACLVRDGAATMNSEGEIERLRIALPMLDITTIGAGGGSIGWIDAGGLLRMGPESAGASPGPACYGTGTRPTCTDADLVLGYLNPDFFAGGKISLATARARDAIRDQIAAPLDLDVEEAAAGMYRVINANMAHGVREITVKRGVDPREFPLVVAGGAGALHMCMIAAELGIPRLLVPLTASTLCATGMLLCDLRHDFVRSCLGLLDRMDMGDVRDLVAAMAREGQGQLRTEGVEETAHEVSLDLRYLKQYHEVTVPTAPEALENGDIPAIEAAFHLLHNQLYGYDLQAEGTGLELINVRVQSLGRTAKPPLPRPAAGNASPSDALKQQRRAYSPETGSFTNMPVYDGHRLLSGNRIPGPALVERTDTTVFISAAYAATVDECGSILIERQEGGES